MDFIWQSALDFWNAHFYISPFWGWALAAIPIFAALWWVASFFPSLRPYSGVAMLLIVAGLFGYRRGETDAEKHAAKAKPKAKPQQDDWW